MASNLLAVPSTMTTLEKITSLLSDELDLHNITAGTSLEALGLDSLEFASLMTSIGKEIADIPESEWGGINTIGDILRLTEKYAHVSS